MNPFDQGQFDLRCEWGLSGLKGLAQPDAVVVVIDVLSFSTTVDIAVARGVSVLPFPMNDAGTANAEAFALERRATLAGRRDGSSGVPWTLSPASLLGAPRGLRLVIPSPNGAAIAFHARSLGSAVVIGSLRNAAAVAGWVRKTGRRVAVIAAGERWPDGHLRPAVEDWIGAGAILACLPGHPSPEAETAIAAFERARPRLGDILMESCSGRELAARGHAHDVELAAALDVSRCVPVMRGDEVVDGAPHESAATDGRTA